MFPDFPEKINTMWRRKSNVFAGFALLALALVSSNRGSAVPPVLRAKPIPSLLASSRRILDLDDLRDWLGQDRTLGAGETFWGPLWLSPHTILVHDSYPDGNFLEPYQIDLRTGARQRLPALAKAIPADGELKPCDWELSSDGKWVLWRDGHLSRDYSFVATSIKGKRSVRRAAPISPENDHRDSYFWIPGTHKWVNLYSEEGDTLTSAQMYDLDSPGLKRSIPLSAFHIGTDFLGRTVDGTIWSADDDYRKTKVTLTAFRLEAPAQVRRYIVALSKGQCVQQIEMSPDGRTLAWLLTSPNEAPAMLRDNFTLALSRADGSGMRAVAEQSFGKDDGDIWLHGWTPDSKSILFSVETYPKNGKSQTDLREISVNLWEA